MKNILKEKQEFTDKIINKILSEAMSSEFSFDTLKSIRSFAKKVEYCKKYLGEPIGSGSSRLVFQLTDQMVLKLAKNRKGLAQNREEMGYSNGMYDSLPYVYDDSDFENDTFVVSEFVLPAKNQDFKEVFNLSFDEFVLHLNQIYSWYARPNDCRYMNKADQSETILLVENNENFRDIQNFMCDTMMMVGDLTRIVNWGMTRRNGETYMVILDHGCSEEVYNTHYKRW